MATKETARDLDPPKVPGPDATEDVMREFQKQHQAYEEQEARKNAEAAAKSEQVQDAP